MLHAVADDVIRAVRFVSLIHIIVPSSIIQLNKGIMSGRFPKIALVRVSWPLGVGLRVIHTAGVSLDAWQNGRMTFRANRSPGTRGLETVEQDAGDEKTSRSISRNAEQSDAYNAVIINLAHAAVDVLAGEVPKDRQNTPKLTDHCVNAFCSLLLSGRMQPALNFALLFARRGAAYETLVEDLFAAAARRLGDRWVADQTSMVDVNIGSSTLTRTHIALRSLLSEPKPLLDASAIFASFVGQVHVLGLSFAAEHFRLNGWNVRHMPGTHPGAFLAAVAAKTPDIVGLTAATESDLKILKGVIEQLRKLHANPRIIVGGSSPDLARLNADAVVSRLDMGLLAGHRLLG